jgi:hypothetical protein
MKPILTALSGVVITVSLAAAGFAQPQHDHNSSRPPAYRPAPSYPMQRRPPGPPQGGQPQFGPPRQSNSLGADWRLQQEEVRQGVRQRRLMPLGQVIEQLSTRFPGRQLDSGLEYQGDRPIYRVRWMTRDGRRVDLLIDATTGAILSGG